MAIVNRREFLRRGAILAPVPFIPVSSLMALPKPKPKPLVLISVDFGVPPVAVVHHYLKDQRLVTLIPAPLPERIGGWLGLNPAAVLDSQHLDTPTEQRTRTALAYSQEPDLTDPAPSVPATTKSR